MPELWLPGAIHRPGPAWKQGYPWASVRDGKGVVFHTPEGGFGSTLQQLDGPMSKSWHGTVDRDGKVYQHYPLDAVTWHAGPAANPFYPGFEFVDDGTQGITLLQIDTAIRIVDHLFELDHWPAVERDVTLFEHNQFMPTACPSGFFPWETIKDGAIGVPAPDPLEVWHVLGWVAGAYQRGWDWTQLEPRDRDVLLWLADRLR